jgi:putative oxidoreductase
MNLLHVPLLRLDVLAMRLFQRTGIRLRPSITLLRISLGLVFLGFGLLKFIPGLSPVEGLVERTVALLTFGRLTGEAATGVVAAMESTIGLSLLTGRYLRLGLALLGVAMVGILSPIILFADQLFFSRGSFAPTLEAQYVLKDMVLLAAALVVAAAALAPPRRGHDVEVV